MVMSDVPLLDELRKLYCDDDEPLNKMIDALRKFQEGYDEADEEEACLISCENCNLDTTSFIINNKNLCFRCAFNEVFGVLEEKERDSP